MFTVDGVPVTNDWINWNDQWYFFGPNGLLMTGWQGSGSAICYLTQVPDEKHPLGAMYVNEMTPDGQWVGPDGLLVLTGVPVANRPNPYGHTCVEVSIGEQMVYIYQGTELYLSTACVTGKTSAGRNTPVGNFSIYSKETNRYLQGLNADGSRYKSYVEFWMPFYKGYGLHDASWRGAFGGNIYVNSGSHGCVNMPRDAAAALFQIAYVGMPVYVHP